MCGAHVIVKGGIFGNTAVAAMYAPALNRHWADFGTPGHKLLS